MYISNIAKIEDFIAQISHAAAFSTREAIPKEIASVISPTVTSPDPRHQLIRPDSQRSKHIKYSSKMLHVTWPRMALCRHHQ